MTESYGFRVHWSDADGGWYAVFSEIPRLSGFGATREEALAELREVLEAVVEAYRDRGGLTAMLRIAGAAPGRAGEIRVDEHVPPAPASAPQ